MTEIDLQDTETLESMSAEEIRAAITGEGTEPTVTEEEETEELESNDEESEETESEEVLDETETQNDESSDIEDDLPAAYKGKTVEELAEIEANQKTHLKSQREIINSILDNNKEVSRNQNVIYKQKQVPQEQVAEEGVVLPDVLKQYNQEDIQAIQTIFKMTKQEEAQAQKQQEEQQVAAIRQENDTDYMELMRMNPTLATACLDEAKKDVSVYNNKNWVRNWMINSVATVSPTAKGTSEEEKEKVNAKKRKASSAGSRTKTKTSRSLKDMPDDNLTAAQIRVKYGI